MLEERISAEFPFESHFIDVNGAKMHYIEQGEGDPILFLHGVPTWSYLWRNIIPDISKIGRCIAVDLMGFGRSAKPKMAYSLFDHINYITGFIQTLNLSHITLVSHAWGSAVGFAYAYKHEKNIKALAFLEALLRPVFTPEMVALPIQELIALVDHPKQGRKTVTKDHYYIDKVMQSGILRPLTDEELVYYKEPFPTPESRQPIWQFLSELPLGKGQSRVTDLITQYSAWLQTTLVPKLMFYGLPGYSMTADDLQWAKEHLPNLCLVDIGDTIFYPQEYKPKHIAKKLTAWCKKL